MFSVVFGIEVGVQRGGVRATVAQQVGDLLFERSDGTQVFVATADVGDFLSLGAVLLVSVCECSREATIHVIQECGVCWVELVPDLAIEVGESTVLDAEGCAAASTGGTGGYYFARPVHVEEANDDEAAGGLIFVGSQVEVPEGLNDLEAAREDPRGGWVFLAHSSEPLLVGSDLFPRHLEAGIRETQVGEALGDMTQGLLHCVSSNGLFLPVASSLSVLGSEEEEEVEVLMGFLVGEGREDVVLLAKGLPFLDGRLAGTSGRSHDGLVDGFCDKAEITACCVPLFRG